MNRLSTISLLILLVLAAFVPVSGQGSQTEVQPGFDSGVEWNHTHPPPHGEASLRLERALRCSCGCLMDLHLCQAQMQCGISPVWSERIQQLLEKGESEEVILAGFASEFGPSVLMVLPLEGFNWVGYLLPWVGVLTGAAGLGVVLRTRVPQSDPIRGRNEVSPEEWERIQEELDWMKEEERDSGF